ncbi:TrkH family potassium uptake protein [Streptomyces sp. 6N223]|uniref:TrkH family potassium uptake protein n=1 Tax=Streptomyces sp. 6N223 TaxID=3457412 RepID=UPI003FD4A4A6
MAQPESPLRRASLSVHPVRVVVLAFGIAILIGTTLLALPVSSEDGTSAPLLTCLFTATSAVCVTGLVVVDTNAYWSGFGEWVLLALFQAGGFGIMTVASLLALLMAGRLRLRMALSVQAETKTTGIGEVRRLLVRVALISLVIESVTAAILTLRFHLGHGQPFGNALYHGIFHGVSAFNSAGFGLYSDSLAGYARDPWVMLPVTTAVILGAIGFPVIIEVLRHRRRRRTTGLRGWSLHLKLTLATSAALLAAGTLLTLALEWGNSGTLGSLSVVEKVLGSFFHSAMSRSAGFNATDVVAMEPATLLATCVLMFIGGGAASTAGGIKVTTFAVLGAAMLAEVRGEPGAGIFRRVIPAQVLRQALTIALLGIGLVIAATVALLTLVGERFEIVLFEAVSAFGTVGLSAGLTPDLPAAGQLILIALMFIGRVGPVALVSALALRERRRRYRHPEEWPLLG